MPNSRAWWNRAAREDGSWYIATASDPFFERGRRDTDELIAFCGLQPSKDKTLLEIRRRGRSHDPPVRPVVWPGDRPGRV
jgi:hypothetical protein